VSKFVSVERKTINILAYMVKCLELRMEPTYYIYTMLIALPGLFH